MTRSPKRLVVVATALMLATAGASSCGSAGATTVTSTDGQVLVNALCHRCHAITRVQAARKTRPQWTATVSRMQSHGLTVSEQQRAAIITYLAKRDGGS